MLIERGIRVIMDVVMNHSGYATLKDMCAVLPKTREEMLTVKGVGEHKMKKYGESFLRCIEEHRSKD